MIIRYLDPWGVGETSETLVLQSFTRRVHVENLDPGPMLAHQVYGFLLRTLGSHMLNASKQANIHTYVHAYIHINRHSLICSSI